MIEFQPYETKHEEACLEVFRSNIPQYFAEKEVPGFLDSLNAPDDLYEVCILDGEIIGVGGIWVNAERKEAGLCFGMIHRSYHKRGYGKLLLERRLERISDYDFVEKIIHETGDGTYQFYEKYGFKTVRIDKDPLSIGIDFHQMERANRVEIATQGMPTDRI